MARKITVDCEVCESRVPIEHAKEAMFEVGKNAYHLMDLCPECLGRQLQAAESVNDTGGYRQKVAVLIRLPGSSLPEGS